jgi:hypothetical protein
MRLPIHPSGFVREKLAVTGSALERGEARRVQLAVAAATLEIAATTGRRERGGGADEPADEE